MSPDTIAVGVFTIAGTLLGVVVGALTERLMRVLGRLRCEASEPSLVLEGVEHEEGYPRSVPFLDADFSVAEKSNGASYELSVELFNGKEVPIGLRNIAVEIVLGTGKRITSLPYDPTTSRETARQLGYDRLGPMNLPPRQFVRRELKGHFHKEAALVLVSGAWRRMEFVGELPRRPILGILGSKTYRKTIA